MKLRIKDGTVEFSINLALPGEYTPTREYVRDIVSHAVAEFLKIRKAGEVGG